MRPAPRTVLRAAADDADATASALESSLPAATSPEQKSAQRITLDQRWRTMRYKQKEAAKLRREAFNKSPAVQNARAFLAAIDRALRPLYVVLGFLALCYNVRVERYMEFCYMETKRIWQWKRRTDTERLFWLNVCRYVRGLAATLAYEGFVPVSILWGVLLPLYMAWVLDDNLLHSPIILGVLLVAPVKFVPGFVRLI